MPSIPSESSGSVIRQVCESFGSSIAVTVRRLVVAATDAKQMLLASDQDLVVGGRWRRRARLAEWVCGDNLEFRSCFKIK